MSSFSNGVRPKNLAGWKGKVSSALRARAEKQRENDEAAKRVGCRASDGKSGVRCNAPVVTGTAYCENH